MASRASYSFRVGESETNRWLTLKRCFVLSAAWGGLLMLVALGCMCAPDGKWDDGRINRT
jgi:hypothetical protein